MFLKADLKAGLLKADYILPNSVLQLEIFKLYYNI